MSDVCVTVPLSFGLQTWIDEGDPAGTEWSGQEWFFNLYGWPPNIKPGERVYIVCAGRLRGFAPLVRIDTGIPECAPPCGYALVRHGAAQAVTIDEEVKGFRGYRYRWWERDAERAFPDWQEVGGVVRPTATKVQAVNGQEVLF